MTSMIAATLTTKSGLVFDLILPRVEDVRIEDIAASLSNVCRFNGQCREFYSVAQHSVWVSQRLEALGRRDLGAAGELHDAHEAYYGDWTAPLMAAIRSVDPAFVATLAALKDRAQTVIEIAFGCRPLSGDERRLVKEADWEALATERRDLIANDGLTWWCGGFKAVGPPLEPLPPDRAEQLFLDRWEQVR